MRMALETLYVRMCTIGINQLLYQTILVKLSVHSEATHSMAQQHALTALKVLTVKIGTLQFLVLLVITLPKESSRTTMPNLVRLLKAMTLLRHAQETTSMLCTTMTPMALQLLALHPTITTHSVKHAKTVVKTTCALQVVSEQQLKLDSLLKHLAELLEPLAL